MTIYIPPYNIFTVLFAGTRKKKGVEMRDEDSEDESGGYVSPREDVEAEGEGSQVADFFRDRCVFITGVSGFVGKVRYTRGAVCPKTTTLH